jgi:hypothetical protein
MVFPRFVGEVITTPRFPKFTDEGAFRFPEASIYPDPVVNALLASDSLVKMPVLPKFNMLLLRFNRPPEKFTLETIFKLD